MPATSITVCGRVHLGPCCVNGGSNRGPMCMACGDDIAESDRDQINRTWRIVDDMLAKHRAPKRAK